MIFTLVAGSLVGCHSHDHWQFFKVNGDYESRFLTKKGAECHTFRQNDMESTRILTKNTLFEQGTYCIICCTDDVTCTKL